MEVEQVLHMNGGMEDKSYAMSSLFQRRAIAKTQPTIEKAITGLISSSNFSESNTLAIADLGCASGPNTLLTMSEVIKAAEKVRTKLGHDKSLEFQVFLNDLSGNDFNNIFRSLQGFREKMKEEMGTYDDDPNSESLLVFFNGVPGSFYGRLFPANSLHFVHSCYSIQWLSQVPKGLEHNKGNIYIASSSPSSVLEAYKAQFERDFSVFLRCRAQEVVPKGRMVLTVAGRRRDDLFIEHACYTWELLSIVLHEMASEGLIDDEKLDSLNIPFYMPSAAEVEAQIQKEGSFTIEHLEAWESNWYSYDDGEVNLPKALQHSSSDVAKCMRAVAESILVHQVELQGETLDEVFRRYGVLFGERMTQERNYYVSLTVSLTRR